MRPSLCTVAGPGVQLLLFVAFPVPPAITPNHGSMNRLLWIPWSPVNGLDEKDNARIYTRRFLGRVSVGNSRLSALHLWTIIKFVAVCLLVTKTIFKPATSNIRIRIPCRSIILWSGTLTTLCFIRNTHNTFDFIYHIINLWIPASQLNLKIKGVVCISGIIASVTLVKTINHYDFGISQS